MIILDANVVAACVLGKKTSPLMGQLHVAGAQFAICEPQLAEAHRVLTVKLGQDPRRVSLAIDSVKVFARVLDAESYAAFEATARARLHERAQTDWPVLAAALAYDGAIWSNDRDFFGVGVPVWSSRNVRFAAAA